jgi:2-amino-4-hydroxy-6-hydroxymethyldihydropteridine diphosphokinase
MSALVYLGIGTNLGDRLANLTLAVQSLSAFTRLQVVSPVYETLPWGFSDQPPFLNLAVQAETSLKPAVLLRKLKKVEVELGRKPSFRYGPRLIDIDILFYGSLVWKSGSLVIPHPHLHERAFVLVPLADLAPSFRHPLLDLTVADLLAQVDTSGVSLYASQEDLNVHFD